MNQRGRVLIILLTGVVLCVALWLCTSANASRHADQLGEVTAVVEGDRPGTVVVRLVRSGEAGAWRVDDSGNALGWVEGDGFAGTPQPSKCLADLCYRVAGEALRVERSGDGGATFATAWEVSGTAYTRLTATYPHLGDPAQHLSSQSLVVHAVPDGHVVFVADGRDGLLFRDVRGAWHRLGSPDSGEGCCFYEPPPPLAGSPLAALPAAVGATVAALILLVGLATAASRRAWRELPQVGALAVLGGLGAGTAATLGDVGMFPGLLYSVPAILAITIAGTISANRFTAVDAPRRRPDVRLPR